MKDLFKFLKDRNVDIEINTHCPKCKFDYLTLKNNQVHVCGENRVIPVISEEDLNAIIAEERFESKTSSNISLPRFSCGKGCNCKTNPPTQLAEGVHQFDCGSKAFPHMFQGNCRQCCDCFEMIPEPKDEE